MAERTVDMEKTVLRFSARAGAAAPSPVRELMKRIEGTSLTNLSAGLPDPALVPAEAIAAAAERVCAEDATGALSYGTSEGYLPLRDWIARNILAPRGVRARAEDVMITNGSQQGLDLVGKVFIDRGTPVVVERPTYMAAIQAFSMFEPKFRDVPLTTTGIDPDALDTVASGAAFFYCVTSFHNPAGTCYSEETRSAVAAVARRHGLALIEDNPYDELYYEARPPAALAAHCPERAIVLGTFSKTVCPGFRLGWLWTGSEAASRLVVARQAADLCPGSFVQRVLFRTLEATDLAARMGRARDLYRTKRDLMAKTLAAVMPAGTVFTVPPGGMFFWVRLPGALDASRLLERCLPRGVVFTPGSSFFAAGDREVSWLRLNFTGPAIAAIEPALTVLGEEARWMAAGE